MTRVCVLMSTYNGERYLRQQIDSILGQTGVDVRLLVRDDGSKDGTLSLLAEYGDRITVVPGDNIGYARSFWTLLQMAGGSEYYAFCDQDDIWLPEKLSRSVSSISAVAGAALSTGNVICADEEGVAIKGDAFPTHGPLTLAKALQRSILPGCTFVFNEEARMLLARYDGAMESHDWLAYIVVTAMGRVVYVDEPGMLYRLHGDNALGVDDWLSLQTKRIQRLLRPSKRMRSRVAKGILATYGELLGPEERETISLLADYRDSLVTRLRLALDGRFPGIVFKAYALLGRV